MRGSRPARGIGAALALLAGAVALSGCTSNPVAAAPASSAPKPAVSASVVPVTPTTPPPTQQASDATPVSVKCRNLVPGDVADELQSGMTLQHGWEPEQSPAAALTALNGKACAWKDDAGDFLEVAVAKPSTKDVVALKNDLVRRSNSVPTYGQEAYFQVEDHVGRVDAFRGRTWVYARSNRFFEPGDAAAVIAAADHKLGLGPEPSGSPTDSPSPSPTD